MVATISINQNTSYPSPLQVKSSAPPASSPAVQVALFFLNTFFLHMLTAHIPLPEPAWRETGQAASMVFSPVSAGVSSFTPILRFIKDLRWSILSLWKPCKVSSVGPLPIAIRIPVRFVPLLDSSIWKPVSKSQSTIDLSHASGSTENNLETTTVAESEPFSLPHTACIKGRRLNVIKHYSYFAKFQAVIGFLQVSYSIWQAYTQFSPLLIEQGLATPILVALPALYMSFLNMIANLVQRWYTHIIILPPLRDFPSENRTTGDMYLTTAAATDTTTELAQVTTSAQEPSCSCTFVEFDDWFRENHPDIEVNEEPNLQTYSFFGHHFLAIIVLLFCLALLTKFRSAGDHNEGQVALLSALFLDPVLNILLAIWQRSNFGSSKSRNAHLGIIVGVKFLVWIGHFWGWYVAGKLLHEYYSSNSKLLAACSDDRSTNSLRLRSGTRGTSIKNLYSI
jgi:hypothetical protein